jgi:hypothetical protein
MLYFFFNFHMRHICRANTIRDLVSLVMFPKYKSWIFSLFVLPAFSYCLPIGSEYFPQQLSSQAVLMRKTRYHTHNNRFTELN